MFIYGNLYIDRYFVCKLNFMNIDSREIVINYKKIVLKH